VHIPFALFKAETEEELNEIDGLGVPELSEAVNAYHTVTTSPEYQEYERMMAKASHDEAQALYNAERRATEAEREKWIGVAKENKRVTKENKKITKENEALKAELEQLRKG